MRLIGTHAKQRQNVFGDRVRRFGVVTIGLVVAAPWLMRLFLDPHYFDPAHTAQLQSVIDFARYCLPQVFFYGMFVLVGQVLNARGRFGPMMWAPIANNSVGKGPEPTRVVYALITPITRSMREGPTPAPVQTPPATAVDDVTNG